MDEAARQAFETALRDGAYAVAWRYCCRLTASADDAQELLQDSIAHALPRFAQLRERDAFRGWLLAIVRTRHLMALRARRYCVPLEAELAAQLEAEPNPDTEAVLHALRSLPAPQRELLELFYIGDLSLTELSRVLGVPAAAAKHRLHRAREALRRAMTTQSGLAVSQQRPEEA